MDCVHVSHDAEQKWCLRCPNPMVEVMNEAGAIVGWSCECGWYEHPVGCGGVLPPDRYSSLAPLNQLAS